MKTIDDFRGEYRWLSNFHLCTIHYEHLVYPSTEHAYQAAKSEHTSMRMLFTTSAMTCREAKRAGGSLTLRADWEQVKDGVMLAVLRDKFTRHADLRVKLLSTGDAQLIEGNTWGDTYWGVCRGIGKNMLGTLLMQVRSELAGG